MKRIWGVALIAGLSSACPADDGGTAGGASDGGVQRGGSSPDLCAAHLAWDMGCAELEPEPREDAFWGETECPMGPWDHARRAYLEAAAECFETLPCEGSDDVCVGAGLAALGIEDEADVADDALYQRCVELAHGCDGFISDACLGLVIFTDAGRALAADCLELECSAIQECLRSPGG